MVVIVKLEGIWLKLDILGKRRLELPPLSKVLKPCGSIAVSHQQYWCCTHYAVGILYLKLLGVTEKFDGPELVHDGCVYLGHPLLGAHISMQVTLSSDLQ